MCKPFQRPSTPLRRGSIVILENIPVNRVRGYENYINTLRSKLNQRGKVLVVGITHATVQFGNHNLFVPISCLKRVR